MIQKIDYLYLFYLNRLRIRESKFEKFKKKKKHLKAATTRPNTLTSTSDVN